MKVNDKIHSLMIVSSVSSALDARDSDMDLRGTLTDKINVENFCYNYQRYNLHQTVQFSEDDARKYYKKIFLVQNQTQEAINPELSLILAKEQPIVKPDFKKPQNIANIETIQKVDHLQTEEVEDPYLDQLSKEVRLNRQSLKNTDIKQLPLDMKDAIKKRIEARAKRRIRRFFDRKAHEHCVLFFSGHGDTRARFILNSVVKAELSLRDVVSLWDEASKHVWKVTDKWGRQKEVRNHLLIIIDACRSGSWTRMLEREIAREHNDISIQSSSSDYEKSFDDISGTGGYFLSNFLCVNGLKDLKYNENYKGTTVDGKRKDLQHPTFYSKMMDLGQIYGLRVGFNRWEELEWRVSQSLKGTFIADNGDVLSGEFKSIQLHGKGQKKLSNGRIEIGTFFNDKLDGEGTLEWNSLVCSGNFRSGQLLELHSAKLTLGGIITSLHKKNKKQKFTVVVQDDMVQEIKVLNQTNQTEDRFEWIRTCYANSDISEGMFRNGIAQGLHFHFSKLGGFVLNFYLAGSLQMRFLVDEHAHYEFKSYQQTQSIQNKKQTLSNSPLNQDDSSSSTDKNHFSFSGTTETLYPYRAADFWESFVPSEDYGLKFGRMKYSGAWSKMKPFGSGEFTDGKGNTYKGSWAEGLPEGKGTMICADGSVYSGFWVAGCRHGIGRMDYKNGDSYTGEWRFDYIFGKGKYKFSDGFKYTGLVCKIEEIKSFYPKNYSGLGLMAQDYEGLFEIVGLVEQKRSSKKQNQTRSSMPVAHAVNAASKEQNSIIYSGEVVGKYYHGFGLFRSEQGKLFEGEFFRGMLVVDNFYKKGGDDSEYFGQCLLEPKTPASKIDEPTYQSDWVYKMKHGKGILKNGIDDSYEGTFFLDRMSGHGCLKTPKFTYEGQFREGKMEGKGKMVRATGEIFEGEFWNNLPHGYGRMVLPNKNEYYGEFKFDMYYTNVEDLQLPDGSTFSGKVSYTRKRNDRNKVEVNDIGDDWHYNSTSGQGILKKPNGDVYECNVFHNTQNGAGKLYAANGDIFEGEFNGDQYLCSMAKIDFPDGSTYSGQAMYHDAKEIETNNFLSLKNRFLLKMISGAGTYINKDGEIVEGIFDNNILMGNGCLQLKNKERIVGYFFLNTVMVDNQKIITDNGSVYTGQILYEQKNQNDPNLKTDLNSSWKLAEISGKGTMISKNKNEYSGFFKKGLRHGQGELKIEWDGSIHSGRWHKNHKCFTNGSFVSSDGTDYEGEYLALPFEEDRDLETVKRQGHWHSFKRHGKGKITIKKKNLTISGQFYMDYFVTKDKKIDYENGEYYVGRTIGTLLPESEIDFVLQKYLELKEKSLTDDDINVPEYPDVWKAAKRHDWGTYFFSNKVFAYGKFDQDQFEEYFDFSYPNGAKFIGNLKNGLKNGKGELSFTFLNKAVGYWINDKFACGNVRISFDDKTIFERKNYIDYVYRTLQTADGNIVEIDDKHYVSVFVDSLIENPLLWLPELNLKSIESDHIAKQSIINEQFLERRNQVNILNKSSEPDKRSAKITNFGISKLNSINYVPKIFNEAASSISIRKKETQSKISTDLPLQKKTITEQRSTISKSVQNKETYEGDLVNGVRHGKGELHLLDGGFYKGEFEMGLFHGLGSIEYPNGDIYSGRFVQGRPHGRGELNKKSGEKITGYFVPIDRSGDNYKVTTNQGWPIDVRFGSPNP